MGYIGKPPNALTTSLNSNPSLSHSLPLSLRPSQPTSKLIPCKPSGEDFSGSDKLVAMAAEAPDCAFHLFNELQHLPEGT